ncbi:phospholipid hydroperoxide glutathione peroxidase, chloroplastic [Cicer arietinum]|uniref:Glutathione peroxidase n=1 Tax=Cicer arietinum TaxID=3827 RepID=A0A1S2Y3J5_CICAR|nr:phospholipid hydroperoxide glutathione peroxidase, chloroplastic [Cicer arietinum]
MSSMAFSTTFFTPLHDFNQSRTNPIPSTSFKPSIASSKSPFFQHGFSQQTSFNSPKLVLKTRSFSVNARAATEKTIYEFTVKDIDKKDVSLSKYKGKVLLIVNVASKCGLTSSNYSELSHLYDKFKSKGLEVLAFPCNQFGMQEPGSNEEIKKFACTKFKAEFPIFDKVDVNGPFTAPVYQFLKSSSGGFFGDLVKWNFEKFLIDKNGKVIERYPPTTSPFQIEKDIQKLLAA